MARSQLTIDNAVAAELAGSEDAVLRALEGHLGCELFLRGNVLTLDGDAGDVRTAETVVGELVEAAIAEAGASDASEMGKVMGLVMPKVAGRADGKRVSGAVRERLAG